MLKDYSDEKDISSDSAKAIGEYEDNIAQIEFKGRQFSKEEAKIWFNYIDASSSNPVKTKYLYEKFIVSQPDNKDVWLNYFKFLEEQEKHDIAIDVYS